METYDGAITLVACENTARIGNSRARDGNVRGGGDTADERLFVSNDLAEVKKKG